MLANQGKGRCSKNLLKRVITVPVNLITGGVATVLIIQGQGGVACVPVSSGKN